MPTLGPGTRYLNPQSPQARIMAMGSKLAKHRDLINATQAFANLSPYLKLLEKDSFRSFLQAQPPETYIDNQALEGFIDFFKKRDCPSECAHCNYCQEVADKVVRLDQNEAREYVSVLSRFLDDLTSSRIFKFNAAEQKEGGHNEQSGCYY